MVQHLFISSQTLYFIIPIFITGRLANYLISEIVWQELFVAQTQVKRLDYQSLSLIIESDTCVHIVINNTPTNNRGIIIIIIILHLFCIQIGYAIIKLFKLLMSILVSFTEYCTNGFIFCVCLLFFYRKYT